MPPDAGLLLDTHIWIWLTNGTSREIGRVALRALTEGGRAGRLRVSVMSAWEVGTLYAKGRVRLSIGVEEWVRRALEAPGLSGVDLTADVALESTRLPGSPPRDPVDRILIATTRTCGFRLVTRDRSLLEYAGAADVSALDARR